jgi:hypothetical protein
VKQHGPLLAAKRSCDRGSSSTPGYKSQRRRQQKQQQRYCDQQKPKPHECHYTSRFHQQLWWIHHPAALPSQRREQQMLRSFAVGVVGVVGIVNNQQPTQLCKSQKWRPLHLLSSTVDWRLRSLSVVVAAAVVLSAPHWQHYHISALRPTNASATQPPQRNKVPQGLMGTPSLIFAATMVPRENVASALAAPSSCFLLEI